MGGQIVLCIGLEDMIEKLINEYSQQAYEFAVHLCGSAEEAKELMQESFFRLIRHWDQYDASQPLENYFMTVMRNLYYDGIKKWDRGFISLETPVAGEDEGSVLADALADEDAEDLQTALERREVSETVRSVLEELAPEYKAVLIMSDMQGLGYNEIASVLDCSLGTVRSRLWRARNAFKKKMRKHLYYLRVE